MDDEETRRNIPAAVKRLGIDFPVYTEAGESLGDRFGIDAIPLTIIVDEHRRVLHVEAGERDWDASEVREQVEKWLAG
jgi:hypothetical protein